MNFSTAQKLGIYRHKNLDFADIHIDSDNRLYIDPMRIHLGAIAGDPWAKKAEIFLNDFFDSLCDAAAHKDFQTVHRLAQYCGEVNATCLGMSRDIPNGNGASEELIFPAIDQMIQKGFFDKKLVTNLADIPIWARGIDADRTSDWITNIIWPVLEDFTLGQYQKYALSFDYRDIMQRHIWDTTRHCWILHPSCRFAINNRDILLCPKKFLHYRLLLTTEDFLVKQVLEYRQRVHLDENSDLCHHKTKEGIEIVEPPTKKDLMVFEVKGQDHVDYVFHHAGEHPDLLYRYHQRFEPQAQEGKWFISDEELDNLLYT